MNEIKFRLHTENKIVGYESWNYFDLKWNYEDTQCNKLIDIPFHVGKNLYTGLKDKNNVKIYEGDIVAVPYVNPMGKLCKDTINRNSEIIFKNGCFYEVVNNKEGKLPLSHWQERGKTEYIPNYGEYTELLDKTVLEIIGNIYQNPEKLKEKK